MFRTITIITLALMLTVVATAAREEDPAAKGLALLEAGDADGAVGFLEEAVRLDPDNSVVRTWLGRAYIAKLQTVSYMEKGVIAGRALEQLEKAVALDPANVEARATLASYYLNAPPIAGGSTKKARQQAEAVLGYDEVRGNSILAGVLVKEEKYDEAAGRLRACIAADPENAGYHWRLGMVYQQKDDQALAREHFETAVRLDPDDERYRRSLNELASQ